MPVKRLGRITKVFFRVGSPCRGQSRHRPWGRLASFSERKAAQEGGAGPWAVIVDSFVARSTIFLPLEPTATEAGLMETSGPDEARSWAFLSRLMEGAALAGGVSGRWPGRACRHQCAAAFDFRGATPGLERTANRSFHPGEAGLSASPQSEVRVVCGVRERFLGRWCNGSTADFGSVCPGSNPGRPVLLCDLVPLGNAANI